jgi:restriction system protein
MGYYTRSRPGAKTAASTSLPRAMLSASSHPSSRCKKARPNSRSGPSEIRELAGLLAPQDERGMFVSTGGYTRDAENDAKVARIGLVGMDRLVELLLENYEKLGQDAKSLVPLRRIYVP